MTSEANEPPSKSVRLAVFLDRLRVAPPAGTFDEAFRLIEAVLNEVEDELTNIPYDPNGGLTTDCTRPSWTTCTRSREPRE